MGITHVLQTNRKDREMKTFQLIEQDGRLHFPHGGSDWDAIPMQHNCAELPSMLVKRYEGGDIDTCPWPMVPAEYTNDTVWDLRARLASALYDERESNAFWPNEPVTIMLPDGERFDLDEEMAAAYDSYPGHQREYNPDNYGGF
jgi:hypothetical protein